MLLQSKSNDARLFFGFHVLKNNSITPGGKAHGDALGYGPLTRIVCSYQPTSLAIEDCYCHIQIPLVRDEGQQCALANLNVERIARLSDNGDFRGRIEKLWARIIAMTSGNRPADHREY